jgi:hypothetical protein
MVWPLPARERLFSRVGATNRTRLVLLAVTAVSGCFSGKAYEGAARPESSVSTIYGHNRMFQSKMMIRQVDDQEPFLAEAEILPGKHRVLFFYAPYYGCIWGQCGIGSIPMTAAIEMEAGHKYQIEDAGGHEPWAFIVDTTTGKEVWRERVTF